MPPKAQASHGQPPTPSSSILAPSSPQEPRQDWLVWAMQMKKEHHGLQERMGNVETSQGDCHARVRSVEATAAKFKDVDTTMKDLSSRITALQADERDLDDWFKKDHVQIEKEIEKTSRMQQQLKNLETRYKRTDSEVSKLRSDGDGTKQKLVAIEDALVKQDQSPRLPRRNDPDDVRALKARLDSLESRGRDEAMAFQDKILDLERKNHQLDVEVARLMTTMNTPHHQHRPKPPSQATTEYFPSSRPDQVQVLASPEVPSRRPFKRNLVNAFREESPISEAQRRRTTKHNGTSTRPVLQKQLSTNVIQSNTADPTKKSKRMWTFRAMDNVNPEISAVSSQLSLENIVSGNRRAKAAPVTALQSTQVRDVSSITSQDPSSKKGRRPKYSACERCHLKRKGCEDARPCFKCVEAGVECVPRGPLAARTQVLSSQKAASNNTIIPKKQSEMRKPAQQKPEPSRRTKRYRRAVIEDEDDAEFLKSAWAGYKG